MATGGRGASLRENWHYVFLAFLAYSVFGWCYEVFLETVVYGWGFSNRGFLFGPYCPVYGFGALLLLALLRPLQKKRFGVLLVFLGTMLLATAVELATSYIMEALTGGWLWDYRAYAVQYDGRIALSPSLRFGCGGLLFLYGLQPLLAWAAKMLGPGRCRRLGQALGAALLIDLCATVLYAI